MDKMIKNSVKGVHWTSETKVMMDGQAWLKTGLKKSIGHPILCVSPLETKGGDGQSGLKMVLKGVHRTCILLIDTLQG